MDLKEFFENYSMSTHTTAFNQDQPFAENITLPHEEVNNDAQIKLSLEEEKRFQELEKQEATSTNSEITAIFDNGIKRLAEVCVFQHMSNVNTCFSRIIWRIELVSREGI
jgi:hypothetical protein